jgi:hypothetical protein
MSRRSDRSFRLRDAGDGGATMKYWVNVPVQVVGYEGDLGDNIDLVVEELAKLDDCNEALLDYSAESDATDDTAEFAVTVEATGLEDALRTGLSCIRSAIHATGAATPDWDDSPPDHRVVVYQIDTDESVEVRPLVSA